MGNDSALRAHVSSGALVPVNIGGDGSFGFTVKTGDGDLLNDRERRHVVVSSADYVLVADGPVVLSGLEAVGDAQPEGLVVPLDPGRWAVKVSLIDWTAEDEFVDEDGDPRPGALSDFVIELRPAAGDGPFRRDLKTFDQPE